MENQKNLVLLIPGNPSVPGIYDPFLQQVVADLKLEGSTISKVLPHLGQCNEKRSKHQKVSVLDVVEDHRKTVINLIRKHSPEKVILVGHSLGSAVTISLYRDLENVVDQFVILCPFLGPSKNNERYLKMFKNPITRYGMIGITHTGLANKRVARRIFRKWLGENPFNEHIPQEIKKPYYLHHFFSLVSHYFSDFEELNVKQRVSQMNPAKSFFLFAPDDYWVPEESLDFIPKDSRFLQCEGINHDFCLRDDQYKIVSKAITGHLSSEFSSK